MNIIFTKDRNRFVCSFSYLDTGVTGICLNNMAEVRERYAGAMKNAVQIGGKNYHTDKIPFGVVFEGDPQEIVDAISKLTGRNWAGFYLMKK
jgi:hypothetical protein